MDPITVRWNGPLTVDGVTEEPDGRLTAGSYVKALVAAHDIPGSGHELVFPDGEPVPNSTAIELLAGQTLALRAAVEGVAETTAAPKKRAARKAAAKKARARKATKTPAKKVTKAAAKKQ